MYPGVAATEERVSVVFDSVDDGWTAPQVVPDSGQNAEFARLQADGQGRIHLICHQGLGNSRSADYPVYSGGMGCDGSWAPWVEVDDGTDNSCWPQLAADGAGGLGRPGGLIATGARMRQGTLLTGSPP